jgi:hypothetical protein
VKKFAPTAKVYSVIPVFGCISASMWLVITVTVLQQVYPKHPPQQASQKRTLCGLGAAEALRGRNTRRVPIAAPLMKWKWKSVEIICDSKLRNAQGGYFSAPVVAVGLSTV